MNSRSQQNLPRDGGRATSIEAPPRNVNYNKARGKSIFAQAERPLKPSNPLKGNRGVGPLSEIQTLTKVEDSGPANDPQTTNKTQVQINLETAARHEAILFHFRESGHDLSGELMDNLYKYWTNMNGNMMENVDLLFEDAFTARAFVSSRILELKACAVLQCILYQFFEKNIKRGANGWLPNPNLPSMYFQEFQDLKEFKNVLQLIHLNFCYLVQKLILHLSPNIYTNVWTSNLIETIRGRKNLPVKNEQLINTIKLNNQIITAFISKFTKTIPIESLLSKKRPPGLGGERNSGKVIPSSLIALLKCPDLYDVSDFKMMTLDFALRETKSLFIKSDGYFNWLYHHHQLSLTPSPVETTPIHLAGLNSRDQDSQENEKPQEIIDISRPGGAKEPYLPPISPEEQENLYTLCVDMDETLVHYYEEDGVEKFRVRPGVEAFLREMSKLYEVVVFTAGQQDYADWILDRLPGHECIKYRLYRHHTVMSEKGFVKDLSKVGRDISRMIIIDNNPENFRPHIENGIFIQTWIDDEKDEALNEIKPLLREIVVKKVKDVRKALQIFRDHVCMLLFNGVEKPHETLKFGDHS